jgi:hypothetical protein
MLKQYRADCVREVSNHSTADATGNGANDKDAWFRVGSELDRRRRLFERILIGKLRADLVKPLDNFIAVVGKS